MLKKVFIQTLHNFSFPWFDKWIENCNSLGQYGWDWHIFTDMPIESRGNIIIHKMTLSEYEDRIFDKCDVRATIIPNTTKYYDFHPALGYLFEEYIKDYVFWGWTNFDVVYGRLDRFLSDEYLNALDIFANDPPGMMCGPFTILRNNEKVNKLFMQCANWKNVFSKSDTMAFDESKEYVNAVYNSGLKVINQFWQENTKPVKMMADGSLVNEQTGQEVMMIHFRKTKQWPLK